MGSSPSTTYLSANSVVMDKQAMLVRQILLGEDKKITSNDNSAHTTTTVENRDSPKSYTIHQRSHHSSNNSLGSNEASLSELFEIRNPPQRSVSPPPIRRESTGSNISSIAVMDSMDSSKGRIKAIQSNSLIHSYDSWSHESIDWEECRHESEKNNMELVIKRKKKSSKHSESFEEAQEQLEKEEESHKKKKKINGWVQESHHLHHHHHSNHHHKHSHHHLNHHNNHHHHHLNHHQKHSSLNNISAHESTLITHNNRYENPQPSKNNHITLKPITLSTDFTRHSVDGTVQKSKPSLSPRKLSPIFESSKNALQGHNAYNLPLIPFHLNLSASWDRQKAIDLYEKSLKQHADLKSAQEYGS